MTRTASSRSKKRKRILLDLISSKNYKPMRAKDIFALLDLSKEEKKECRKILNQLTLEGSVIRDEKGRYVRNGRKKQKKRDKDREKSGSKAKMRNLPEQGSGGGTTDAILAEIGIRKDFPEKAVQQAEHIRRAVDPRDMGHRMDLRGWQMVTIDGEDSRDLDDAVSLSRRDDAFLLGVHIADVSHYVQEGSPLDKEALKRGTSVYLADQVVPMLPKKLSNGICSLNAGEDRLALSCLMKLDFSGKLISSRIAETVIRVDRRMTYPQVDRIFAGDPAETEACKDVAPMLSDMRFLADVLRKMRLKRGMIDFLLPESKICMGDDGIPSEIVPFYPTEATRLIEQFMLEANETVARTCFQKQIPFVYRIHDKPDPDKIEETLSAIRNAGFQVTKKGRYIRPAEINRILHEVRNSPENDRISTMLLRSMRQARYDPECAGHFGLAARHYCHFTSPIRRYPDLQIHRIIKEELHGDLSGKRVRHYRNILDSVAWKSSALERRAVEAERESTKLMMARYVAAHIGETHEGVISGVTGWGFYVRLENTVEGLVSMRSLKDDFYIFDEDTGILTGKRKHRSFMLGQTVAIRFAHADVERRNIDFTLCDDADETGTG